MSRHRRLTVSALALTLVAAAQLLAAPVVQADPVPSSTVVIQGPIRCC